MTSFPRALAASPTTPVHLLAVLCRHDDSTTRQAAAANPNTPPDALAALVADATTRTTMEAAAAAANPSAGDSTVHAALYSQAPRIRIAAASNPALSRANLQVALSDEDPWVVAAAYRGCSETVADAIAALDDDHSAIPSDPGPRAAIAANPVTARVAAGLLTVFAVDQRPEVLCGLASNPDLPGSFSTGAAAAALATDPDPGVRRLAAANPVISAALFARDPEPEVRVAAVRACRDGVELRAFHRDTDPGVVKALAVSAVIGADTAAAVLETGSVSAAAALAANPAAAAGTLADLCRGSSDTEAAAAAAANPNCPPEALTAAVTDPRRAVRAAAAANPATPPEALTVDVLVEFSDDDTAAAMASNPALPEDTVRWLAARNHWPTEAADGAVVSVGAARGVTVAALQHRRAVRIRLAANPGLSPRWYAQAQTDPEELVVERLAANPSCPPEILEGLADKQPSGLIERTRVAANPNTAADVLRRLAEDPHTDVLRSLAANPNTPPDVLSKLRNHKYIGLRDIAHANPSCPDTGPLAALASEAATV